MRLFKGVFLMAILSSVLLITGCGRTDFQTGTTEVSYLYQNNINDSVRYDAGNNYYREYPFQDKYNILKIDYGVQSRKFSSTYTLPAVQKISVSVSAEIIIRLKKSSGKPSFSNDKLSQFYSSNISPAQIKPNTGYISANLVYQSLMVENEDKAFRSVFTDVDSYPSFDILESNIIEIQERIKKELILQSSGSNIEILGVRINDIPVPGPIKESRDKALELDQKLVNQQKDLKMRATLAAEEQAIAVREALNDVTVDMIANRTDKGYQLVKAIKIAAQNGSPMNLSITPSLMEYVDKKDYVEDKSEMAENKALYERLRSMSNEEMVEYFGGNK